MARTTRINGEPTPYQNLNRKYAKDIRSIRGIYKAWQRAPKFLLRLRSSGLRYYLSNDEQLTTDRKQAKVFRHGFDNPQLKIKYWNNKLGLSFYDENYVLRNNRLV